MSSTRLFGGSVQSPRERTLLAAPPMLEALDPRLLLDGTYFVVNSLGDVVAWEGEVNYERETLT